MKNEFLRQPASKYVEKTVQRLSKLPHEVTTYKGLFCNESLLLDNSLGIRYDKDQRRDKLVLFWKLDEDIYVDRIYADTKERRIYTYFPDFSHENTFVIAQPLKQIRDIYYGEHVRITPRAHLTDWGEQYVLMDIQTDNEPTLSVQVFPHNMPASQNNTLKSA